MFFNFSLEQFPIDLISCIGKRGFGSLSLYYFFVGLSFYYLFNSKPRLFHEPVSIDTCSAMLLINYYIVKLKTLACDFLSPMLRLMHVNRVTVIFYPLFISRTCC